MKLSNRIKSKNTVSGKALTISFTTERLAQKFLFNKALKQKNLLLLF
jgi:hypothetical protein